MPDKTVIDLIHRELDGALSDSEKVKLDRLLAGDPEARAIRSELRGLAGSLGQVKAEVPPPSLKSSVMRAVEELETRRQRLAAPATASRRVLFTRPRMAFAGGLIAGIALFAAVEALTPGMLLEEMGMRGTFSHSSGTVSSPTPDLVVNAGSAGCTLIRGSDDPSVVRLSFTSPGRSALALSWDGPMTVSGVRQVSGAGVEFEVRPGNLLVRSGGTGSFEVDFEGAATDTVPVQVYLTDAAGRSGTGTVTVGDLPRQ